MRLCLAALLTLAALPTLAACRPGPRVAATAAPEAPELPASFDAAQVDAWVAAALRRHAIVGAQLVVAKDGKIVLSRSYGEVARGGPAVTADTAFAIGSITKQFVCAAALVLEHEGKLAMTDTVAAHWPELTRAADITLDDLGSHLSGYPDYYPLDFLDRRMQAPIEPDALIARYAGMPLDFEPRTRWSYSNTGFIMLGRLIERRAGEPLGAWLGAHFFGPAGMRHASLDPPSGTPGLATGHTRFVLGEPEVAPREAPGWIFAAGGIYASAEDLMRWNLALAGDALVPAEARRKLTTPRVLADGRSTDYGCGLGVRQLAGETVWTHSGAVSGFLAHAAFVPRTKTGVVLLANTDGAPVGDLQQALLGVLLAPPQNVPTVAGPGAKQVAGELFAALQAGRIDRARVSEELAFYYDEDRLRAAQERLSPLGAPERIEVDRPRERGGMEVTVLRFVFADRTIRASMYRAPSGEVQQFLLLPE